MCAPLKTLRRVAREEQIFQFFVWLRSDKMVKAREADLDCEHIFPHLPTLRDQISHGKRIDGEKMFSILDAHVEQVAVKENSQTAANEFQNKFSSRSTSHEANVKA